MNAETSAAALAMQTPDKMRTDKQALMIALVSAPRGLTRRQLAEKTGIKINTINARVTELKGDGWATDKVFPHVMEEGSMVSVVSFKKQERLF